MNITSKLEIEILFSIMSYYSTLLAKLMLLTVSTSFVLENLKNVFLQIKASEEPWRFGDYSTKELNSLLKNQEQYRHFRKKDLLQLFANGISMYICVYLCVRVYCASLLQRCSF